MEIIRASRDPLIPATATEVSTARKSGSCEAPFKTGSPDYREKSSLLRRSICVVSYMPSYPIFAPVNGTTPLSRARAKRARTIVFTFTTDTIYCDWWNVQ